MNKKTLLSTIIIATLLFMPLGLVRNVAGHSAANPSSFVNATIWGPETVDPAWSYDTASAELIMNVYDTLVSFYVDRTADPPDQGKTDTFVPNIATEWVEAAAPHPTAPGYTNTTYYFKIRTGVPFHCGGVVTPADVEYSIERWMAFDRSGGPAWMIYEPLLAPIVGYGADFSDPLMPQYIDDAVESNATHVWFNVASENFPPMVFMQTIAQAWASIISQSWAATHGCWDGVTYTNASMFPYYDPDVSPFDDWPTGTGGRIECGSGPYTLYEFNSVEQWYTLERFAAYWNGWSAPGCNEYGFGGASSYATGWLQTVTVRGIDEWGTRKTMFLAGDADFCYVPRANLPELVTNWDDHPDWDNEEYPPGIECYPGLPTMSESNLFYNFNITVAGNSHVGDGDHDSVYETGIAYWFFDSVDVRKAFSYCFNWTEYIADVFLGEAYQPSSPEIQGLAYWEYMWDTNPDTTYPPDPANVDLDPPDTVKPGPWNQPAMPNGTVLPPNPMYYRNLTKAEEYFKAAWGGQVWANGFTFDILYNTGNTARRTAALMLEEAVESLNPKFHIGVYEVDWPVYLGELVAMKLTLFIIGWLADYPDPHNFFFPYMHTEGTFSYFQSYSDPEVDDLIETGITTLEDDARIGIYWTLCNKYFDDAVSVPLVQGTGRHWTRDWVQGWYYNPIYPGQYYYHMWKGYQGDVNRDYIVDIFDLVKVAGAYGTSPGDPKWDPASDINGDGTVDIFDLVLVAGQYG